VPEWSLERRRSAGTSDVEQPAWVPPSEPPDDTSLLRTLFRISQAVMNARFFDEALEAIAEETLRSCGGSSVSISRWERDIDCLRTLINVGVLGPGEVRWPAAEMYAVSDDHDVSDLLKNARPYVNSIDDDCDADALACLRRFGKESEVGVPIAHGGAVWGEIWMAGAGGRRFGDDDLHLLDAIARHVAGVLGRTEQFSATWRDAREDPLTRLPNRRALDERLNTLFEGAAPCTLAICDLDGFKLINDSHGHAAGDEILRQVATVLKAAAANHHGVVVSRFGGDEFCVLLPRGDMGALQAFAQRVTTEVRTATADRVTATWGAVERSSTHDSAHRLLDAADGALNYAKSLGRGRFSSSTAPGIIAGSRERRITGRIEGRDAASRLLTHVVDLLDAHRPATAVAALEILAVQAQRAVDAAGWAVLERDPGSDALRVISGRHSELDPASGLWMVGTRRRVTHSLADLAEVSRAVAEGNSALITTQDNDPATGEARLLTRLGCASALVVAANRAPTSYLLSIASTHSVDTLEPVAKALRVLAQYCVAVAAG
jgi:diguanylate cyclase (GGDEF)-like protein